MEKIEADMVALGTRMDTRVGQLMEIIQNMALQQEELRALVVRPAAATTEGDEVVPPPQGNALSGIILEVNTGLVDLTEENQAAQMNHASVVPPPPTPTHR